ncbi:hypothetical protein [Limnofasciculus baicalensis]|uniref:Uncharacterized protein n=1 Tax=Limnofasciculus baicalensis BBK-W-15 TaxID=2699891 RepID=A0AAE3GZY2_9CYAN|nr:hypothetical protein [Limnofasciculus baicalensis]MCP2731707.1 hypothetical protein [Limnofasciculus baicalensis BBK-W-15]
MSYSHLTIAVFRRVLLCFAILLRDREALRQGDRYLLLKGLELAMSHLKAAGASTIS